jgi:hypothetical protein
MAGQATGDQVDEWALPVPSINERIGRSIAG